MNHRHQPAPRLRPLDHDREGTAMLLHEALARSRQQAAQEAAHRYALAHQFTAGSRWARIARFADRRAARARSAAGAAPLTAVSGLDGAI